ncbi:beta-phosphoglucomutase [Niveispirillum sp. BGYR6]|uniref:beta-phosphoglucomutase n=1 Tax=Niveispirillum sp. BGYR6 TaxID=2971249 RepID=UPI0022B94427|nr:beta-phosphoglucomutase [Niveispirillum sp. BGYR6]
MQERVPPTRPAMGPQPGRPKETTRKEPAWTDDTGWVIRRTGYDPEKAAQNESLFALANGTLGVRGGIDEVPSLTDATFLADFFEQAPIHYHERFPGFATATDTRVPVADGKYIRIVLGDEPVNIRDGLLDGLLCELDLRAGTMGRILRWTSPKGASVEIEGQRLVSLAHPQLMAVRLTVRSLDYSGPVALLSSIQWGKRAEKQGDDPRIGVTLGHGGVDSQPIEQNGVPAGLVQQARFSQRIAVIRQTHRPGPGLTAEPVWQTLHSLVEPFSGELTPGQELTIEKFVAYGTAEQAGPEIARALFEEAGGVLAAARAMGWDGIARRQRQELDKFWGDADVTIEGDPALQQAIRFNLFHLFQSTGRTGTSSIAAKGLTGEGYEGHYFWDTETFVLPALALTDPGLARRMLEYRVRGLERARAHARAMGHAAGALYPWRTIAGDECSAHYPSGSAQYHINADIAFAVRFYEEVTGDSTFLYTHLAEMLFETVRIWPQIGRFNPRKGGAFTIHEVTGPDEYTALVNNNFYTNAMAQAHLAHAADLYRRMAREAPDRLAVLAGQIGLMPAEADLWQRAADAMYLPTDPLLGVSPQDDDFLDKPLWDFAGTPLDKFPLLLHFHPLALYRHQVCKQADVVQAMLLAGQAMDNGLKRRNFAYYEPITVHDSTLSPSTHAIIAAELGEAEKALAYYHQTARVDLDDLHGNASHGVHMAAMAGSWLGIAWGFGGLRWHGGIARFRPTLPAGWAAYGFGILWQGRRLRVQVTAAGACYSLLEGPPLTLHHYGKPFPLTAGESHCLALSPFPWPARALIFDLDGVLTDTAEAHYQAWKRLADDLGVPFDRRRNEAMKGIDRETSLTMLLDGSGLTLSPAARQKATDTKNGYYQAIIAGYSPADLFDGVRPLLAQARAAGLKIGVASASRNAPTLLDRLGILGLLDHVADAGAIAHPKPAPDIFLSVATALGVAPSECIGIEDSQAGITAIKAAGMVAIGIGDRALLKQADTVFPRVREIDLPDVVAAADNREGKSSLKTG